MGVKEQRKERKFPKCQHTDKQLLSCLRRSLSTETKIIQRQKQVDANVKGQASFHGKIEDLHVDYAENHSLPSLVGKLDWAANLVMTRLGHALRHSSGFKPPTLGSGA